MSAKNAYIWESKTLLYRSDELKKILTELSNDGWEIFSVTPYMIGSSLWVFIVHRKLQR